MRQRLRDGRAHAKPGKATRPVAQEHPAERTERDIGPEEQTLDQRENRAGVASGPVQLVLDHRPAAFRQERDGGAVRGGVERQPAQSASSPRNPGSAR